MRTIYVEILVRGSFDQVWQHTQEPAHHQRWDLRFQRITYLPRASADAPQRFRYATAGIDGVGISTAERTHADGGATSSLRFSSTHPLSVIDEGAGYWRYVPVEGGGLRFLTGYHYRPRHRLLDVAFGPMMGWATAWSFDRLRLWVESGITPERARRRAVGELLLRIIAVAGAFVVHPAAGVATAITVTLLPTLPGVPSARRCLRRPPDRLAATAPTSLERLAPA
ncbi:hypothetical protein [Nocardioides jensenii]|uniref:hypothetical protein n=1 Tax=Nocardioides jensenii TaxID=1843 RepID=UPI00082AC2BC|nr:hypothetical protein [Nocardioides jensenii]